LIGCEGEITLPTLANSVAICKNKAVARCTRGRESQWF